MAAPSHAGDYVFVFSLTRDRPATEQSRSIRNWRQPRSASVQGAVTTSGLDYGCEVPLHFANGVLDEFAWQALGSQVQALLVRSQRILLMPLFVESAAFHLVPQAVVKRHQARRARRKGP